MISKSSRKAVGVGVKPSGVKREKRPSPNRALVQEMFLKARNFSESELYELIKLLQTLNPRHLLWMPVTDAISAVTGQSVYCQTGSSLTASVNRICEKAETLGLGAGDPRRDYALLVALARAAKTALEDEDNCSINNTYLIETLAERDFGQLLNKHFPGYGVQLLGDILCQRILTGSAPSES